MAGWLAAAFAPEDLLVVKIDVEGGEWPFFETLLALGKIHLIDVLAMECHGNKKNKCWALFQQIVEASPSTVILTEGRDYPGYDRMSGIEPSAELAAWVSRCKTEEAIGRLTPE